MLTLDALLAAAGPYAPVVLQGRAREFTEAAYDSRNVRGGELFVAVRTANADGHAHLAEAVDGGATGCLIERDLQPGELAAPGPTVVRVTDVLGTLRAVAQRQLDGRRGRAVVVAGTLGKSTTQAALAAAWSAAGAAPFANGDQNDLYGLPIALTRAPGGTADYLLEVAGGSSEEYRGLAAMIRPDVCCLVGAVDADALYWRRRAAAIRDFGLLPGAATVVVAPIDEPDLGAVSRGRRLVTFGGPGTGASVEVVGAPLGHGAGTRCVVRGPEGPYPVVVPLLGPAAARAVGATAATLLGLGLPLEPGIRALAAMVPPPGRAQRLPGSRLQWVLDDTVDATPAATVHALQVLQDLPGPRVAVLGECSRRPLRPGERAVLLAGLRLLDGLVIYRPGDWSAEIAARLRRAGSAERVVEVETVAEAVDAAHQLVRGAPGGGQEHRGSVLVKALGSRAAERITAGLATPGAALVRQDPGHRALPFSSRLRPTWVEIDVAALSANVAEVAAAVRPAGLMAVVKADGYGHGALQVARTALRHGASWIAVATVAEGLALRNGGIAAPCLVLGHTPAWQVAAAVEAGLAITVFDHDVLRAMDGAGRQRGAAAEAHLKVDTGMSRLGLLPEAVAPFLAQAQPLPGVNVSGCYTHLRRGEDAATTRRQLARFRTALDRASAAGHAFRWVHAANSAGWRTVPGARFTLVRSGIELLGLQTPDGRRRRPVLEFKTRVAQVREIGPGTAVGYGTTFTARRRMRLATIPVGYGDGFRRGPRHWGEVLVRGRLAPIVGDVCMDLTMIDVSAVPDVTVGDHVVLIGRQGALELSAETVAERLGTSNYEVVAQILPRVPRELRG
ncbi:MAG TPA: alanine racemase [Candidatus Dormibacteraeota bacterium]|nr:alanine racemase [Candidatus Dormibacteraeota bacterium]